MTLATRLFTLASLAAVLPAQAPDESREIRKTFAARPRLDIDNVTGSIRVRGYGGKEIRVAAAETVRAETPELRDQARREVALEIREEGDTVSLSVEGPLRGRRRGSCCGEERIPHSPRYEVQYDFNVEVPRATFLALRTVNRGAIRVEDTTGGFDVENINGPVDLLEVSGSGKAYSLNKPLKVVFRSNPRSASCFGSLNGRVDLYFQPGLSADFRMKTFNGKVFTDFPMTSLPDPPVEERKGGRYIYRAGRYTGGRVGAGGVEIKLDGFNGEMRILNRAESK
jgi:hypothetical protein